MLILRRREGESFLIGDDIKVTVLTMGDGSVRLAIDAPKNIPILRSELLRAVDANRDAAEEQARPQELLELLAGMQKQKPESAPLPDGQRD